MAPGFPLAIGCTVVYGLGFGMFDANNMPILCQVAPPRFRATGYGVMNFVGIAILIKGPMSLVIVLVLLLLERFRRGPEVLAVVLTGVFGEEEDFVAAPGGIRERAEYPQALSTSIVTIPA